MGYYEFNIALSNKSKDAAVHMLLYEGCLGFIEKDNGIIAYFPDFAAINKIISAINLLKKRLSAAGLDDELSFDYVFIAEKDWNESWKKNFRPIDIGETITILPPWQEKNDNRINIIIDPGMAFGTGHHETTKTCLMLIEKFCKKEIKKDRFLDLGTGTGILAITAIKLGFKQAVCIDIDQLAIDAAKMNARLNNIEDIEINKGDISEIKGIFDFIAANLTSDVLIQNAHDIALRLNKSGIALFSGMINGQEEDVIKAIEREGLRILEKNYESKWVSIIAVLYYGL